MRLNQTVHTVLGHIVKHLDGSFGWVGQCDDFGDGTFIGCDSAEAGLIETRVDLFDELKREERENEGLVLEHDDHHILS